jgi:hypothetical protein
VRLPVTTGCARTARAGAHLPYFGLDYDEYTGDLTGVRLQTG